ncbi:ABC transporter ATP-binding protein [bacterium]|nr:ABC transporter ATP-binding protein [bacterium]
MSILQAENVVKTYERPGSTTVEALRGVNLTLAAGEFVAVTGSSGSGKSTLLTVLSGLDLPDSGRVLIAGTEVSSAPEEKLASLRNQKIGFIFQDFHLVPSLNAWENVAFPAELAGKAEARAQARALLERVGLGQRLASFPHQLSGGEKQRVALCRAVINRPALLFADEPTGNLDTRNGQEVVELLLELKAESGSTLLLVTHSEALAGLAGRVLVMSDGRFL